MKHLVIWSLCLSSYAIALSHRAPCEPPSNRESLEHRPGFVEFLPAAELAPLKAALPAVTHPEVNRIIRHPDTMWYDEESMVFLYQDSIETVVGGRANCVGRKVGERNKNHPQIGKLLNYFGSDYRFMFPFRTAAGTDDVTNIKVMNFWAPPKKNGKVLPVRWWKLSSRGRWRWAFPVGTFFGEVLYQKSPDGVWRVFEIRTRKRYLYGWDVNLFRPFTKATALAQAVMEHRPGWQTKPELRSLIAYLWDNSTLVPHELKSPAYGKIFKPIKGALDPVPPIKDHQLVTDLLTQTAFRSAEGEIWKENEKYETYGPASTSDYSIVPKGYVIGMIPVNEVSCKRCHEETGRRLEVFDSDIVLYGEVWGEDQIFTWHLFEPHRYIFDTWDDVDGSRKTNSKMEAAGLLEQKKPGTGDPIYRPLPTVFKPDKRRLLHGKAK